MNLKLHLRNGEEPITFEEAKIFIPKKEEQEHIGQLLCNVDSLIALHQRKLEMLKNLKSSLLEKMFV